MSFWVHNVAIRCNIVPEVWVPWSDNKKSDNKRQKFFSVLGSANKRDDRLYEKPKDSSTSKDNKVVEKLQKKLSLKNYFMDLFQLLI